MTVAPQSIGTIDTSEAVSNESAVDDLAARRAHFVTNDRMWSSAMSSAVSIGVMSCCVSARR